MYQFHIQCCVCGSLYVSFDKNELLTWHFDIIWLARVCPHVNITVEGNPNNPVPNYKFLLNCRYLNQPQQSFIFLDAGLYQYAGPPVMDMICLLRQQVQEMNHTINNIQNILSNDIGHISKKQKTT